MADRIPTPVRERKLVNNKRVVGTIVERTDDNGWIEPSAPIDHPAADEHDGNVYFAAGDVQEHIAGVGAPVSFFLYADANGLGAMNLRPAVAIDSAGNVVKTATAAKARAAAPAALVKKAGWEQAAARAPQARGAARGGRPPAPPPPTAPPGQAPGGVYRSSWTSGAPTRSAKRLSMDEVMNQLHKTLHSAISQAISPVAHLETEWTENTMCTRITRYFMKGAQTPDLLKVPWSEAVHQFVEQAIGCYAAACSDKEWFFELDLSTAMVAGLWDIVRESTVDPCPSYPELEERATAQYEEMMEKMLLDKALLETAQALFEDGDPVIKKLVKNLKGTHEAALEEAINHRRLRHESQKVEFFMKTWMEQSMGRAWMAITGAELILTEEVITQLFRALVAPFGEDHPFSCIPMKLLTRIGRPPKDWPFIQQSASQLVDKWSRPRSPPKRRRIGGHARGPGGCIVSGETFSAFPWPEKKKTGGAAAAGGPREAEAFDPEAQVEEVEEEEAAGEVEGGN